MEIVRAISNLLSAVERDVFVPKVLSVEGSDSETYSFVPIYFFPYPELTQFPESIFIFPSLLSLSSSWLRKLKPFPPLIKEEKAT